MLKTIYIADIRFYIASSIGVVASSLVITRRLCHIVNMTATATDFSSARRRRNIIIDLVIGLGMPLLAVALCTSPPPAFRVRPLPDFPCVVVWFYQGHRFNILEGVGCVEAYPNTFLSIFLNTTWPIPIGLASATYALLAFRGMLDRTKDLRRLQIVEAGLTTSRYCRLMVLAAANVLFAVPLTIYTIVINLRRGLYPYRGLADLHSNFGRVDCVAAVIWRQDPQSVTVINFRIWTPILCAFFFFLMFGFTAEARAQYKRALAWMTKPFGAARPGERASDISRMHFRRRPVIESGVWDTMSTQDDWRSTKPALAVMGDGRGMRFIDIGERPPLALGVVGMSAYHIERGSKEGDIVVMPPITEPPPAYARAFPS